jgi:aldose sugar dehydrogenase
MFFIISQKFKDMKMSAFIFLILNLIVLHSCNNTKGEPEAASGIKTQTILTGYGIIWGMDFLPDGDLIFTEKRGKVYLKNGETVTEISGFPEVRDNGQGGLLDIRVHPQYSENGWIYASYAATGSNGKGQLRLIRFKIPGNRVTNIENIFSTDESNEWNGHYGSRIEFYKQNHLYLSVGEGGPGTRGGPGTVNNNAQNLKSAWGKIHRVMDDGRIPPDNPVFPGNNEPTSVFSYGHRNPQGLAMNPETNELWEAEHGPKGGDEINIINKGVNYGWPMYSYGDNYDGSPIPSAHGEGTTEPLFTWNPSIATCGITFITSDRFGSFKGSLLVTGLVSRDLHRCVISGNKITEAEPLLSNVGRVRDVAQAPDGSIYVSVENPGRIIQILPE